MYRASCGAAALVPVSRNTAPLLVASREYALEGVRTHRRAARSRDRREANRPARRAGRRIRRLAFIRDNVAAGNVHAGSSAVAIPLSVPIAMDQRPGPCRTLHWHIATGRGRMVQFPIVVDEIRPLGARAHAHVGVAARHIGMHLAHARRIPVTLIFQSPCSARAQRGRDGGFDLQAATSCRPAPDERDVHPACGMGYRGRRRVRRWLIRSVRPLGDVSVTFTLPRQRSFHPYLGKQSTALSGGRRHVHSTSSGCLLSCEHDVALAQIGVSRRHDDFKLG